MPDRAAQILTLDGPDALAFAHAQLSSDVRSLAEGQWQWSGWLDAQGRVKVLAMVARTGPQTLTLLLRGGKAADFADGLKRFLFRSKVTLRANDRHVIADAPALSANTVIADDENIVFGFGDYAIRIGSEHAKDTHAWHAHDIAHGHPWLADEALDTLLAPALSMERLHAVAFDKGCYPGQEIVARLHYRGGHKRHLHRVESSQALHAGSTINISNRGVGIVLSCVHIDGVTQALAVLDDALTTNGRLEFDGGQLHILETFAA
ncbi:hypothetical protein FHW69_003028 [Luteibacter sp. Sphag1AF]|uniref:CAF17-like 4Fe-4S cluster assembly/insertion protein YgfZ n=1 Tax=Luteibacter sp. Sphag1AF TaxID=2587031 RepID=UPI00160FD8A4|nr:folate-binding protein YgfZ [Luteibacter sp. Sphag1AF]MBB3228393.1 hypothetical protein [Luteibacter sp. Sphag1AF]